MSLTLLLLFSSFVLAIDCTSTSNTSISSESTRDGRLFFLFPLFTPFRRRACYAGSQVGVCYTATQCNLRLGTAAGTCASGRGVCCVFQKTCEGSSSSNYTYFVNPNYPSSYTGGSRCSVSIIAANYTVCQLRINLLEFSLSPPSAVGTCLNDFMSTSGRSPTLCGENTGQHLLIPFSAATSPMTISVDTNSALIFNRRWNMEIIQIPCINAVPRGCTQYYNTTSGSVSSFNYATAAAATVTTSGSAGNRQIAGLDYGICIRPVSGYCSIEWSANTASPYSFTMSGDTSVLDATVLGTSNAAVTGASCTSNFVVIPNPMQNGVAVAYDRFCGNGFVTTTTSAMPFVLTVVTGTGTQATTGNIANRGFNLNYRLLPCT